jgi:hypothetical protein
MINLKLFKTVFSARTIVKNVRIFLSVLLVEGLIETLILLNVRVLQDTLIMVYQLTVRNATIIVSLV